MNKTMSLGIVGVGTVGRAMARCYMEHCEVRCFDVVQERCTHSIQEVLSSDIIFVCLPTTQMENDIIDNRYLGYDMSTMNQFFDNVEYQYPDLPKLIIIRSTVPIGYTKNMYHKFRNKGISILHSPEFLTARCALTDVQVPSQNIIGMPTASILSSRGAFELGDLYSRRFPGVPIKKMASHESELVKLALNSFFATKVAFFNEIYRLADRFGMEWRNVRDGMLGDGRITHSHTMVPGPSGELGYGGACLPKDIAQLYSQMRENEHLLNELNTFNILKSVIDSNENQRKIYK